MTKSCIFKNLNIRKKTDCNCHGNFLENHLRHLNCIQIPQADWPEVVVIWASSEKQNVEVCIFDRTNILGFAMWEFTIKEDLSPQKQVCILNLRLWFAQKPIIWSIFYGKIFI